MQQVSQEQLDAIGLAFRQVDKDNDGEINSPELRLALESVIGEDVPAGVVEQVMGALDNDKDGTITLEEFTQAMKSWWEREGNKRISNIPSTGGESHLGRFLNSFAGRSMVPRPPSVHFNLSAESQAMKDAVINTLNKYNSPTQKCVVFQAYINRIFSIDDVNQLVNVDMYLKLNWKSRSWVGRTDDEFQADNRQTDWWEPGVEVSNAIELEKQTPEEEAFWLEIPEAGVLAYTQRYIGTVATHMDLHQFPFDKQLISINFESFHWKEADMKMVVPEKFHVQAPPPPGKSWPAMSGEVKLHDWHINEINVQESPMGYEFEDRTYSQVKISLKVERAVPYYFWKILVVLWLIVGMSWSVFFCDSEQLTDRLAITVTLFLAAVAFNFAIASLLPKVAYNTLLDYNLLIGYSYIAIIVVENIIVYHVHRSGRAEKEDVFIGEAWFALVFGASYILYNIIWAAVSISAKRRDLSYSSRPQQGGGSGSGSSSGHIELRSQNSDTVHLV